jgi:hypothetical protein
MNGPLRARLQDARALAAAMAACVPFALSAQQPAGWRPIEEVRVPWGARGATSRAIVEQDSTSESPVRVRIETPGQPPLIVSPPGGAVAIARARDSIFGADNLLASRYLYASPKLRDARGSLRVLVFGYSFASAPGSMYVVARDADGRPRTSWSSESFVPTAIVDVDRDGHAELVGVHSLAQTFGRCYRTYDPYAVYRFRAAGPPAYDERLSRSYTSARLGGWRGRAGREDWVIVECAAGGPRLVPAAAADTVPNRSPP